MMPTRWPVLRMQHGVSFVAPWGLDCMQVPCRNSLSKATECTQVTVEGSDDRLNPALLPVKVNYQLF